MQSNRIYLPFYLKLILLINNRYFTICLLYSFLGLLTTFAKFEINTFTQSIPFFILVSLTFFILSIFNTKKKIRIIEGDILIKTGTFSGDISLPEFGKYRREKIILRLTLQVPSISNHPTFYKNFYFIKQLAGITNFEHRLIINAQNPEQVLLLRSLPNIVKKYINTWEKSSALTNSI